MHTIQVHPSPKALPEATGWAVLPPYLIDDAVIPPSAQVVVLSCGVKRQKDTEEEDGTFLMSHEIADQHWFIFREFPNAKTWVRDRLRKTDLSFGIGDVFQSCFSREMKINVSVQTVPWFSLYFRSGKWHRFMPAI